MKIKKALCLLIAVTTLLGAAIPGTGAFAEETAVLPSPEDVSTTEEAGAQAEEIVETAPSEEQKAGEASAEQNVTFAPGDVSGDGNVDAEDARMALRIAVGIEDYGENAPQMIAADIDGTQGVSASDARLILRAAVGLSVFSQGEDHVHVFETEVIAPTCTEEGYTLVACQICGESTKEDVQPPAHHYYKFYCTVCGQMDPLHKKTSFANSFEQVLYDTAHPLFYKTADELSTTGSLLEYVYHRVGKWCCYYTIHDVFRPALKKAGYSDEKIEQIAPVYYTSDKIEKVLRNSTSLYVPIAFMGTGIPMYVPSMLLDYYIGHPQYAKTYIFKEYYDDLVEQKLYQPSENRTEYTPQVGDILFMSNKTSTYVNGYPTVDHTAQIIMMYDDGSFWCTEGSLIQSNEDGKPRVRERMYFFNNDVGAYEYLYNPIVVVLAIAKPDLYDGFSFTQP